ncbi:hypothetical protein [Spiroplasma endosymbiont of Notiophilus biguttatus]|uniref:hypothetical protein n=1 Tax=Spiroplasma endosymbiont of Notiophilus biguttatus TaxID=3066285 RepID=UPI00313CDF23
MAIEILDYEALRKIDNKIKKRRKRCVECDELYNDDYLNMTYYFKTEEESQQHDIKKYEDDYDIEEHLDYTKPYGYVCDWCRSD